MPRERTVKLAPEIENVIKEQVSFQKYVMHILMVCQNEYIV